MPQSQATPQIYDAVTDLLKAVLPEDCRIFHGAVPLQVLDSLQRQAARICVWLISSDQPRVNTSGATPVHEITLEASLFGQLGDIDSMVVSLTEATTGNEIEVDGWTFDIDVRTRRDMWEAQIQTKRAWLQFRGLVIEPATGTDG